MAIGYVGAGVKGEGTTSADAAYPSGSATDIIIALCVHKPYSTTVTNANYSQGGNATSGSVANGNGTGSVRSSTFTRSTSPTAAGSDAFTSASTSPIIAQGVRFSRGGDAWATASLALSDTDETGTTVSATGSASAGQFKAGDVIVINAGIKDDAPNHTSQTLTIPGCTLGSITWLAKNTTTQGNDGAQYFGYVSVTAGSSTASTVTYAATSSVSGASSTAVNLVRLRELTTPNPPTGVTATADAANYEVDLTWTAPASGPTPTSYSVYRDGVLLASGIATTSYSDTTTRAGVSHSYTVRSVADGLVSSDSSSDTETGVGIKRENNCNGTDAVTVTSSNTGGPNQWDQVTTSLSGGVTYPVFDTAVKTEGTASIRFGRTSALTTRMYWSGLDRLKGYTSVRLRTSALPAALLWIHRMSDTTSLDGPLAVGLNTDGTLCLIRNDTTADGVVVGTTTGTVTLDSFFGIEAYAKCSSTSSATDGELELRVWWDAADMGTTAPDETISASNVATKSVEINEPRFGWITDFSNAATGGTATQLLYVDEAKFRDSDWWNTWTVDTEFEGWGVPM